MISSLFVLANCGGGGGGSDDDYDGYDGYSNNNLSSLASMNITDAKSIFIKSGSGSANVAGMDSVAKTAGNSSSSRLFKINSSDAIEEVSFYDDNNNKITLNQNGTELVPVFLEKINDEYIAVGFTDIWNVNQNYLWIQTAIIARKSDGKIFLLKNIPDSNSINTYFGGYIKTGGLFKADNAGNIYYINQQTNEWIDGKNNSIRAGVTKISVSGDKLTSTIITPSAVDNCYFCETDDAGNVLWRGYSQLLQEEIIRITTPAGLTKPVPTYSTIWTDLDGKFHYIDTANNPPDVKMINPETLEPEPYGTFSDWADAWADYKVSLGGYTYLMSYGGILEVYNPGASPRSINLGLTITNIYGVACTENYYYIAGKDSSSNYFLIRVTPGGTSYTPVLGNEYQVYAFSVSESDGITFNALRTSDMKKVLGKVSINGGGVTLLNAEEDMEVVELIPLN